MLLCTNLLPKRKNERTNRDNFIGVLWTCWLIVSSGAIGIWVSSGWSTIIINFAWALLFLLMAKKIRIVPKREYTVLLMCAVLFLHYICLGFSETTNSGTLHILSIICMVYSASIALNFNSVLQIFSKIIVFLAVISVVFYLFQPLILNMRFVLPKLTLKNGIYSSNYTNLYLCLIKWEGTNRNCGIFWEPGAYQIFLNVALLHYLFLSNEKHRLFKIAICCCAIMTTVSTAGIAIMLFLFCAFIAQKQKKGKWSMMLFLMLLAVAMLFMFSDVIFQSLSYKFGFETGMVTSNVSSRTQPFLLDLEIMKNHPFGVGIDRYGIELQKLKSFHSWEFESSSCTPTIMGAGFGVPCLLLIVYGFLRLAKNIGTSTISKILFAIALWLLFATESFILYPLFYYLLFWGLFSTEVDTRGENE